MITSFYYTHTVSYFLDNSPNLPYSFSLLNPYPCMSLSLFHSPIFYMCVYLYIYVHLFDTHTYI